LRLRTVWRWRKIQSRRLPEGCLAGGCVCLVRDWQGGLGIHMRNDPTNGWNVVLCRPQRRLAAPRCVLSSLDDGAGWSHERQVGKDKHATGKPFETV